MGLESLSVASVLFILLLCMSAGLALKFFSRLAGRQHGPNTARIAATGIVSVRRPHLVATTAKERLIIVGDVHGCFDELTDLLQKCTYNSAKDELIFVGDLVNKGPKSVETVQFVRTNKLHCVRGNHDDAALSAALKIGRFSKFVPESYNYVKQFSDEDLEFLSTLPLTLAVPAFNAMVVHAGLVPGVALGSQTHENLTKMRNLIAQSDGSWIATEGDQEGISWAGEWRGVQHIYFGHDAKRGLQRADGATGLDTGCCYGKKLSAIILPSREIVQVDAREVYVQPKSD